MPSPPEPAQSAGVLSQSEHKSPLNHDLPHLGPDVHLVRLRSALLSPTPPRSSNRRNAEVVTDPPVSDPVVPDFAAATEMSWGLLISGAGAERQAFVGLFSHTQVQVDMSTVPAGPSGRPSGPHRFTQVSQRGPSQPGLHSQMHVSLCSVAPLRHDPAMPCRSLATS